jgi:hypothetical protein
MSQYPAERRSALSEKHFVLGRREKINGGVLNIGRYYALDGSLGAPVYIDALHPHMVFICGKRGYGKSYSIGVFLEEIASLEDAVRQNLAIVVLDTLGIFWSTQYPSKKDIEKIHQWGRTPQGFSVRIFAPACTAGSSSKQQRRVERFSIRVADLSPLHWCQLFDLKTTDPVSVALTRAIFTLRSSKHLFSIPDILRYIDQDIRIDNPVKSAAENFFVMADSWDVFDAKGLCITDFVRPGTISVLDLSVLHSQVLKDIVVALLCQKIFEERVQSRKVFEQKKMGFQCNEIVIPLVWLAIDEAQVFIPSEKRTLSKEVLIGEWMRQGRQPGLSLLLATQRPCAVEPEVLSHCDLILCHRLTAQEDIDALGKIRPTYMHGQISESIKKIGSEKGVALLVDDTSEAVHVIQLRPRLSWHGGAEPIIDIEDQEKNAEEKSR